MTDFVHLHLHTEYSLLDGAVKVDDLVRHCKENNISAVAVTDHGNMYASLRFAEKCKKNGIKYIIGCEFYVVDDYREHIDQHADHLILLAKNKAGYVNLVQLDSLAFVDGYYYRPRIDYTVLKEHTEGVICLSACLAGRIPRLLMAGEYEQAKAFALEMKAAFGEDFYIEIQDHGIPEQKRILPLLVRLARETDIQLVATNDVHYLKKEDWEMQDVLMCIQTKRTLDDPSRMKMQTHEFYMKSGDEMAALFPNLPDAIANTRVIADKVSDTDTPFNLKDNGSPVYDKSLIPLYTADDGTPSPEYLTKLTMEGLPKRYDPVTDTSSSCGTISTGRVCTASPWAPGAARAWGASSHTRSASRMSIRCGTTCCLSVFSIPTAFPCPTSTSTSARRAAARPSNTSAAVIIPRTWHRSSPSVRSRRAPSSRMWDG